MFWGAGSNHIPSLSTRRSSWHGNAGRLGREAGTKFVLEKSAAGTIYCGVFTSTRCPGNNKARGAQCPRLEQPANHSLTFNLPRSRCSASCLRLRATARYAHRWPGTWTLPAPPICCVSSASSSHPLDWLESAECQASTTRSGLCGAGCGPFRVIRGLVALRLCGEAPFQRSCSDDPSPWPTSLCCAPGEPQ